MNRLTIFLNSILALALLMLSTASYAEWVINVTDDAFDDSKRATLLGVLDEDSALMYECEKGNMTVSYLEPNSKTEIEPSAPEVGDMAVKIDKETPYIFESVTIHRQNEKYIALRSTDEEKIKKSLMSLRDAKHSINVGLRYIVGGSYSKRGDVYQSTSTVNAFATVCGIELR